MTTSTVGQILPVKEHLTRLREQGCNLALSQTPSEQIEFLNAVSGGHVEYVDFTAYFGGRTDTRSGERFRNAIPELAEELRLVGELVFEKGTGPYMVPGLSVNGRCRDEDLDMLTLLALDCDGAGDWALGLRKFQAAGLAYVVQRSVRHTPDAPKWHLFLPLQPGWRGSKWRWRQIFGFLNGYMSGVCCLDARGFDPSTDRLLQPIYVATRRIEGDSVPEVRFRVGRGLDVSKVLEAATVQVLDTPSRRPRTARVVKTSQLVQSTSLSLGDPRVTGLLGRAFVAAGWAGRLMSDGRLFVRCPWEEEHSSGSRYDSSTVIFPGDDATSGDVFHCSHAHCSGQRSRREVLKALPPEALQVALRWEVLA